MIPYKIIAGLFGICLSDFSFYLGSYIYWYFECKHCAGYVQFVTLRKRQLCSLLILIVWQFAVYTKTFYTKDVLHITSIPQIFLTIVGDDECGEVIQDVLYFHPQHSVMFLNC